MQIAWVVSDGLEPTEQHPGISGDRSGCAGGPKRCDRHRYSGHGCGHGRIGSECRLRPGHASRVLDAAPAHAALATERESHPDAALAHAALATEPESHPDALGCSLWGKRKGADAARC